MNPYESPAAVEERWSQAISSLRSADLIAAGSDSDFFAEPPTEQARQRALSWLELRQREHPNPSPARVSPSTDGGIAVEFYRPTKEIFLSVEFLNDGTTEYTDWDAGKTRVKEPPCSS